LRNGEEGIEKIEIENLMVHFIENATHERVYHATANVKK
jgi:hypothetical protein